MDTVKVTSSINIQELCAQVSENAYSALAVSLACQKDLRKCTLWDISGCVHKDINNSLSDICYEIRKSFSVINIVIHCRQMVSNAQEPCIGIACSAETYVNASCVIQYAFNLLSGNSVVECTVESTVQNDPKPNTPYPKTNNYIKTEEKHDFNSVPQHLIQINVGSQDVKRRIASFINQKRERINAENKQDFCSYNTSHNLESNTSCARVDAVFIRRNDSKSHLRIRKVHNAWGPQIRHNDTYNSEEENNELYEPKGKKMKSSELLHRSNSDHLHGLEERIKNIEDYVKLPGPVPSDVYTRLKSIEDRIIYMESLSPEYFQYWNNTPTRPLLQSKPTVILKKTFTSNEIKEKIKAYGLQF